MCINWHCTLESPFNAGIWYNRHIVIRLRYCRTAIYNVIKFGICVPTCIILSETSHIFRDF